MKTYKVEKLSLGDKVTGDQILFENMEDLKKARLEVEDGRDLYVMTPDNVVTALPYRMIYQKIYDGTIRMSAKSSGEKEEK
jgi:hypothetical protein